MPTSPRSARGAQLADVLNLVGPLYRRATRSLEVGSVSTGVSVGVRAVLELLAATEPQTVPRIAERLELSRQFVQRSVDDGLSADLVVLQANPSHVRSRLVALTPSGSERLAAIKSRERDLLADAGADLDPREIEACLRVLGTLLTRVAWD